MKAAAGPTSLDRGTRSICTDSGTRGAADIRPLVRHGDEARSGPRKRQRHCIVVIEDEPDISALLATLFDAEGYRVIAALNADSALRLVQSNHPDAITLDLGLPDRDGQQLLYELKGDDSTRGIPVIVVSAYAGRLSNDDRRLVAAIVDKPFDLGDLLRITRDTLSADCPPRA